MSSLRACSSSSSRVLTPRFLLSLLRLRVGDLLASATALEECALVCGYISVGKDCAWRSVVLVLVFTAVRVCVRLRLCGQGLRLSLRVSGARVHCRARWCADTSSMGKDCACLSVFLVLVFTAVCDLIRATARLGVRIRLLGKDCACLSVVLVLSAIARVGMRYLFLGKDCACLPVVLVLSAIARVGLRIRPYGQGLRLSLRVSGARVHCRI